MSVELGVPIRPTGRPRRSYRESTLESADDAAGIFSLYGDSRARDSTQSHAGDDEQLGHVIDGVEELSVEQQPQSPAWAGPVAALNGRTSSLSKRNSAASSHRNSTGPPITITAHNTPEKNRYSSVSSSTGYSPSPINKQQLSPKPPTTTGNSSASTSQISIAASSQYPGEEADAFHVRSTYARLEVEGVFGDGWDEGVERTRERAQVGNRKTLMPPCRTGDVGEKEREFLANLDRYGFVNEPLRNRSETRLALIPTSPLLRFPKLSSESPLKNKQPAQATPSPMIASSSEEPGPSAKIPSSPTLSAGEEGRQKRKEDERVSKWEKMMSVKKRDQGGNVSEWKWAQNVDGKRLDRRIYKGIPDRWRMAAWWTLAESKADGMSKGKKKAAEELGQDYRHSLDLPSSFDVQIDLDVPRTISGHVLFHTRYGQGQRSLFHALHCFSMLCDSCGYCQGMGPIAATLLCYFDPERAYALLVRLHDGYQMHSIFAPGFPGLLEGFYVQEKLMEYLMPEVYTSFQKNMISASSYATKWYITLFVNTVPFKTQLRIWDAMFLEGREILVMTSVAIIWSFKDLLASPHANFESILSLLSSYFVAEDEDALLRWIRKMMGMPRMKERMSAWRREWEELEKNGKSGMALL
ncbi:hypothetical protein P7C73_g1125, partial [Tremellales sp. Uapishka_1]